MKHVLLWAWIVVSFACSGCASWFRSVDRDTPETRRAIEIVWAHYGAPGPAPGARFIHASDIREADRCTSKATGRPGFLSSFTGLCLAGQTVPIGRDGCHIDVVLYDPAHPSDSALAHELLHCARLREHAPLPHHTEGNWRAPAERDGYFFSQVEAANEALRKEGL